MTEGPNLLNVTLRYSVETNETLKLYMSYYLPWNSYVSQANGVDFTFQFSFFEEFNSTIGTLTVEMVLPTGAKFGASKHGRRLVLQFI